MSKRIKEAVEYLHSKYCIKNSADFDLTEILGAENIHYEEYALKNCLGTINRRKKFGIITVSDTLKNPRRKRFVIGHELGHWMLHPQVPNFNCNESNLQDWHMSNKNLEAEANYFSAEFLMPYKLFNQISKENKFSIDVIFKLANTFNTSVTSTSIRYADIGDESVMVVYSRNKFALWYKPSSDFKFSFYEKDFPIPPNTLTSDFFNRELSEPDSDVTLAKKWFPNDYSVKDDQYLNEAVIPMKNLGSCITFLWQHETNFNFFYEYP